MPSPKPSPNQSPQSSPTTSRKSPNSPSSPEPTTPPHQPISVPRTVHHSKRKRLYDQDSISPTDRAMLAFQLARPIFTHPEALDSFLLSSNPKVENVTLLDFKDEPRNSKEERVKLSLEAISKTAGVNASYTIENNTDAGFASLFTVVNEESGKKYFVKKFLNGPVGRIDPQEFFIYKVLEHLGYGPKCFAVFGPDEKAILVSEDLSQNKVTSAGHKVEKTFKTYREAADHQSDDMQYLNHVMAIEILVQLLDLLDVHSNEDNSGIVISKGPKTQDKAPKVKPKIIDFTVAQQILVPHASIHPLAKLTLEEVISIAESRGQSAGFLKKIEQEKKEQSYKNALRNLLKGRASRPSIFEAVDRAYKDCESVDIDAATILGKKAALITDKASTLLSYFNSVEKPQKQRL